MPYYGYYGGYGDFLANNIYCILLIPVLLLCGTITYGVCLLRSPAARTSAP